MKRSIIRTLAILLGFIPVSAAFGAFTAFNLWSVIAGGNANNGAMFDPSQTAGMLTNLASTSSSSTTPSFSSGSYNFTVADEGNWVFVGAGAGWQTGFYKITGNSSNSAVVDAAIGHVILYNTATGAMSLSTVAGCGATASGTFAIDYAGPGQTASSVTNSTFASVGSSTNLTDGTATFTPVMVGNAVHITNTGTGGFGILGWYTITAYTSATSVTVDRTTNTGTAMAAGTGFIGGGVALISTINSASVGLGPIAGNIVWVNGTISPAANDAITFGGSSTSPLHISGYGTYWTDGFGTGRTNGSGALSTTNMGILAYTTHTFSTSGVNFVLIDSVDFTGSNSAANLITMAGNCALTRCTLSNSGTGAFCVLSVGASDVIFNNDIISTGATGATLGINISQTCKILGNRISMSSTNAASEGIFMSGSVTPAIVGNQIFMSGGIGIASTNTGLSALIFGNTVVGAVDDINILTGSTSLQCIVNNMLTDCTNPLNNVSAANGTFTAYNRYRQNTSGGTNAIATGGTWAAYTNYAAVVSSLSTTDYTNVASDLRLTATSPAVGAGWFPSASIGAVQKPAGAGGQVTYGYAQ